MEADDVSFAQIADHPHLGPLLARWHAAEWGHLYSPDRWNEDIAQAEFAAQASGTADTTWVAFDGAGRDEADVLGSVSFIPTDDLEGFEHLTPWLASLYVRPEARARRIGTQLVDHLLAYAATLGIPRVHLFTAGQETWYLNRGWRTLARTEAHGHGAAVMVRDTHPHAPRRALATRWCSDPDTAGAYSSLRPGGSPEARDTLAEPVAEGLVLAGEATWRPHPGTLHGAWFSGERAARQLLEDGRYRTVAVIGAGLAGLAAARALHAAGRTVTVYEAAPEPGGRARTDRSLGGPVHLGGAWLHGSDGHPLASLVRTAAGPWGQEGTFVAGRDRLSAVEEDRLMARFARLDERIAALAAAAAADASLAPVLSKALAELADPAGAANPGLETDCGSDVVTDRTVLATWVRGEYENLVGSSATQLSANHASEPYRLPGEDRFITSGLDEAISMLASGLDLRLGHRVTAVHAEGSAWTLAVDPPAEAPALHLVDAVVVTVAVGALQRNRIRFEPPLPAAVGDALAQIGSGAVSKLFFTFDEPWWLPLPAFWVAAEPPVDLELWVDGSALTGLPTLFAFALGEVAHRVEAMSEDELCSLAWSTLTRAGAIVPDPSFA
jgi:monoamine oxidase